MRPLACLLLCAAVAPAAEPAVSRTFDVSALVEPVPDYPLPPLGVVTTTPTPPPVPDRTARSAALLRELDAVAPDAAGWASFGGSGRSLTVTHTPAVVERAAARITALAERAERQVAVECRLLAGPPGLVPDGPATFDSDQLARSLATVQGHARTGVMTAPKLSVFDGQRVGVFVGEVVPFVTAVDTVNGAPVPTTERYRLGTGLEVRPVVAADGRAVTLEAFVQQAEIDPDVPLFPVTYFVKPTGGEPVPFTQFVQQPRLTKREARRTATVPDGHTLVVPVGRRTATVETASGPLARVPYLNRLATTRTPVPEDMVALLTVRVVSEAGSTAAVAARP